MPDIIADNISIVHSDKLEMSTRIDAEHYRKEYIALRKHIDDIGSVPLKGLISSRVITGHTPSMKNPKYYGGDINFIKTDNLRDNQIVKDFNHSLTELGNKQIQRSTLKEKDVIVTIIGASFDIIGRASLVPKKILPANINQNIALIRVNENVVSEYLTVYLNTKHGRKYLHCLSRQTEQVNLSCREVELLKVPLFTKEFQFKIKSLIESSNKFLEQSNSCYHHAENLLIDEVGVSNIALSHDPCYEVNSADTISACRIDAEYYQPKYEGLIDTIKKHPFKTIGDMFRLVKGIEPGSSVYCEEGKPFIRVSNLNKFEINNNNQQYLSEETYSALESQYQPLKGEILLSKDATPGITYHLKEQTDGIISGGILRLQALADTNKEYVCLVINSLVGQSQIERDSGGSVISHWKPAQIKNTLIPFLSPKVQEEIEHLCTESFFARRLAKKLLEEAKRKVEEMIEKGRE